MDVPHPRRILLLAPPGNVPGVLALLHTPPHPPPFLPRRRGALHQCAAGQGGREEGGKAMHTDLTGSAPEIPSSCAAEDSTTAAAEDTTTTASGASHTLALSTRYYTATIPIWIDEPPPPPALAPWQAAYLAPDAQGVLDALGALIFCFPKPLTAASLEGRKDMLKVYVGAVKDVAARAAGGDAVCVAVGLPPLVQGARVEEGALAPDEGALDELLADLTGGRFEYVDGGVLDARARNEFGEKRGVPRLREALEAQDWAGEAEENVDADVDGGVDADIDFDFDIEAEGWKWGEEVEAETAAFFAQLVSEAETGTGTTPLLPPPTTAPPDPQGDALSVAALEGIMQRALHVREQGETLSPEQRRREARRVVLDFLRGEGRQQQGGR
ncbi:MAG: hypothetical protein M1829_005635 [Trizodia sp. TS-e1964]|nr:MAG: hypothetical protein M1829_005635 [Trizodia sp. TS-e1964]